MFTNLDSGEELEKREISGEINKTLSFVSKIIEGQDTFQPILRKNQDFSLWEYQTFSPVSSVSKYFYVVPKKADVDLEKVLFKISEKAMTLDTDAAESTEPFYKGVIFVDVFCQFITPHKEFTESLTKYTKNKAIMAFFFKTSDEFFNYLFDTKYYKSFLKENNDFANVRKFYIDRRIKFLVDEEDLEQQEENALCLDLLDKWVKKKNNKSVLLLGDRGLGKTWSAKAFCLAQYEKHENNPWLEPLPIYIELANLAEPKAQLAGFYRSIIFHLRDLYNIEFFGGNFVWESLIKAGKVVFVLDGFDDMAREVNLESVNRQLWEIFSIINISSKVLLTSRINHFNSLMKIFEHFAYKHYIKERQKLLSISEREIYISEDKNIRKNFSIWQLTLMSFKEIDKMTLNYRRQEKKKQSKSVVSKLEDIAKDAQKGTINYELLELSRIPAFYHSITELLREDKIELIEIFEKSLIITVIGYNIDTDKALDEFVIRIGENFETLPFTEEKKILILQELAWFMFERAHNYFDITRLPPPVLELMGGDHEVLINDLKTQTVIKLFHSKDIVKDESKFTFLTEGVYAYFIANYLYKAIKEPKMSNEDVMAFGKHNLTNSTLGKTILSFLTTKLELDNNLEIRNRFELHLLENLEDSKPYSPWLKYLVKNVSFMNLKEIDLNKFKQMDSWSKYPINIENKLVLIRRERQNSVEHYMMGTAEITNQEFLKFLEDKRNKYLRKELKDDESNPYKILINDYHLYLWVSNKIPAELEEHPVVYISWFAAAFYCNWLSFIKGFSEYYIFEFPDTKTIKVKIDAKSSGYRLPTEEEWDFVAKEGCVARKYPWDKYLKDGKLSKVGKDYKKQLLNSQESTFPVKSEVPNDFGIYGLIGNVREWVDTSKRFTSLNQDKLIKGATWLLGESGYSFENVSKMPAVNTNLDVGFRIARGLSSDEVMQVKNSYTYFKNRRKK